MAKTDKWSKRYWIDLGERVGTTFLYGVIAIITSKNLNLNWELIMTVIITPVILSLAKGLIKNMASTSDEPTASLVNVSSHPVD